MDVMASNVTVHLSFCSSVELLAAAAADDDDDVDGLTYAVSGT